MGAKGIIVFFMMIYAANFSESKANLKVKIKFDKEILNTKDLELRIINYSKTEQNYSYDIFDKADSTYVFYSLKISDILKPYTQLKLIYKNCSFDFPLDQLYVYCGEIESGSTLIADIEVIKLLKFSKNEGVYSYSIDNGCCGESIMDKDIYFEFTK
jgi:hypothetical protein